MAMDKAPPDLRSRLPVFLSTRSTTATTGSAPPPFVSASPSRIAHTPLSSATLIPTTQSHRPLRQHLRPSPSPRHPHQDRDERRASSQRPAPPDGDDLRRPHARAPGHLGRGRGAVRRNGHDATEAPAGVTRDLQEEGIPGNRCRARRPCPRRGRARERLLRHGLATGRQADSTSPAAPSLPSPCADGGRQHLTWRWDDQIPNSLAGRRVVGQRAGKEAIANGMSATKARYLGGMLQ